MKRTIIAMMVAALLIPVAARAAELKYGVMDMKRALNETDEGKRSVSRLKVKLETVNGVLKSKQDEVRHLEEEITKQGYMLSESARSEKELKYRKLREDLEKYREEKSQEFMREQQASTETIVKKLMSVVDAYAKREGLTLIFEASAQTQGMPGSVVWYEKKNDITDKIIDLYNRTAKD